MEQGVKQGTIEELRRKLLLWQGYRLLPAAPGGGFGLGALEAAFPNGVFPSEAVHEFLAGSPEQAAATAGFIGGLLKNLMEKGGGCLWVHGSPHVFPPSLNLFGIDPSKIIFVDIKRRKELLWVTEEALKCSALAAVVAEVPDIDFAESRRLQLTVEKSRVAGFLLRRNTRPPGTTACAARWQISPLPSELAGDLPGVGFPRWNVELLKVRNGRPAACTIEWANGKFISPEPEEGKAFPGVAATVRPTATAGVAAAVRVAAAERMQKTG